MTEESSSGMQNPAKSDSLAIKVSESESLLTQDGTVDIHGEPANRLKTGGFRSLPMITASEFAERTAGFGLALNLISYLFYVKHFHLPDAASMTTNFFGTSFIICLLGGYVADTFLGRFWTIFWSGIIQSLGFSVLVINASLDEFKCSDGKNCPEARGADLAVLYIGLYVVALGTGGVKSSVSAFGADQFDKSCPREANQMSHYFNWFYFSIMSGSLVGATFMVYLQDINWAWGLAALMIMQLVCQTILLVFRPVYRYTLPGGSPFSTIVSVFASAFRNRKLQRPNDRSGYFDEARHQANIKVVQTGNLRWLDKAAITAEDSTASGPRRKLLTVTDVEDTKMVLRLLPILATTWFFWTNHAQFTTFTVAQAKSANRMLGSFEVPPASIGVFQTLSVLLTVLIYDRLIMPVARRFTGHRSGFTTLQRIGVGLVAPILSMICAALVERKRLQVVHDRGLEATPSTPIPSFSMFWFVPQYFIMGVGDVFLYTGQIDFFYNEAPENLQALGTSLSLSTVAIGAFGSSAIVSMVNKATSAGSPSSAWLKDNLNESRLDLYFWLLAILSFVNLIAYVVVSRYHTYNITYMDKPVELSRE
ncbi:hypothetical protein Mapa_003129 [Marchantia paleacea]|nr:hypothetical protein Mapa_003129 [Marchantia paleacea]